MIFEYAINLQINKWQSPEVEATVNNIIMKLFHFYI